MNSFYLYPPTVRLQYTYIMLAATDTNEFETAKMNIDFQSTPVSTYLELPH